MRVTITLKEPARSQAEQALVERGLITPAEYFRGPDFEDALQLNHDIPRFLGVVLNDEEETHYFYPYSDIARIKLV